MTRIFGSNSTAGDWMLSPFVEKDSGRISQTQPALDQSQIVEARAEMERCKQSGEKFYYGEDTPESVKGQLREYAEAIGMENVESVSSDRIERSRMSEGLKVTAQDSIPDVETVFDIMPTIPDASAFEKSDSWREAENSKAKSLSEKPSGEGVSAIRGGEEYDEDPVKVVRPGENSIIDPEAIDKLAESESETTLDQIRAANEMRRNETVFNRDDWQDSKAIEMSDAIILPRDGSKIVEAPKSQNHSWSMPGSQTLQGSPSELPDKTQGEQIVDINSVRKAEISRDAEEDDWEKMESSISTKVSDLFIDNLEKNLKNLEK